MLTTANAAGTNGLTCLPKQGGVRDDKVLVTHPITDLCERCSASTIARWGHRGPPVNMFKLKLLCFRMWIKVFWSLQASWAHWRVGYLLVGRWAEAWAWCQPQCPPKATTCRSRRPGSRNRLVTIQITQFYTYIPLTLYPRRGGRGISDIPPRRFIKIIYLWVILQTWQVVSPSPSDRSLSQV
jgi:hypothetical protein